MSKVQAILFDFGGVLAEEGFVNGLRAMASEQQLAVDDMAAEGMAAVYDSGFVLGRGSEAGAWALLRERTGLSGNDAALSARIINGFSVRPWMLELVVELRQRGYMTGILSDQTDWLDQLDEKYHFYRLFDHVYNSYYMGKGKRDPTVFMDVASDLDIPINEILFIDDSQDNIDKAKSVGMQAIRYVDRFAFLQALKNILH